MDSAQLTKLPDGTQVEVRPVTKADEEPIRDFLTERQCDKRMAEFFSAAAEQRAAGAPDPATHAALVAFDTEGRKVIGHAAYSLVEGGEAELAVDVAEDMLQRGLATATIKRLAQLAETNGIERFCVEVTTENRQMLTVFEDGFENEKLRKDGIRRISFPTTRWRIADSRFAHAHQHSFGNKTNRRSKGGL